MNSYVLELCTDRQTERQRQAERERERERPMDRERKAKKKKKNAREEKNSIRHLLPFGNLENARHQIFWGMWRDCNRNLLQLNNTRQGEHVGKYATLPDRFLHERIT